MENFHRFKLEILLVEDEPIAQIIGQNIIENAGHNLDIANSTYQALAMINVKKYDLIFMDLGLPGLSGLDFTKELMKKSKLETPIIAVTAFNTTSKKEECITSGFKDFIEKPLTDQQLQKIIDRFYGMMRANLSNIA